jgi:hypothetical protein
MSTRLIIVEERLRSTAHAVAIGLVALGYIALMVVWSRLAIAAWATWLALVVGIVGLLLLVLLFVLTSQIVARVVEGPDGRSFEVLYGPGGLVRQVFDSHEIEGASSRALAPALMADRGHRGIRDQFRHSAVLTRRGDALELRLVRNRRFTITVDEPEAFVFALSVDTD